jgi:hypothetical protein
MSNVMRAQSGCRFAAPWTGGAARGRREQYDHAVLAPEVILGADFISPGTHNPQTGRDFGRWSILSIRELNRLPDWASALFHAMPSTQASQWHTININT